jgi:hypothetical protein
LPASPTFGQPAFSAPLYRFDILPQYTYPGTFAANSTVPSIPVNPNAPTPAPTAQANTTQQPVNPFLVNGQTGLTGPIEGRPPGAIWAHQQFGTFPPQVAIEVTTKDATATLPTTPALRRISTTTSCKLNRSRFPSIPTFRRRPTTRCGRSPGRSRPS